MSSLFVSSLLCAIFVIHISSELPTSEETNLPPEKKLRLRQIKAALETSFLQPFSEDTSSTETLRVANTNTTKRSCTDENDKCCVAKFPIKINYLFPDIIAPSWIDAGICRGGCFGDDDDCVMTGFEKSLVLMSSGSDILERYVALAGYQCICVGRHVGG